MDRPCLVVDGDPESPSKPLGSPLEQSIGLKSCVIPLSGTLPPLPPRLPLPLAWPLNTTICSSSSQPPATMRRRKSIAEYAAAHDAALTVSTAELMQRVPWREGKPVLPAEEEGGGRGGGAVGWTHRPISRQFVARPPSAAAIQHLKVLLMASDAFSSTLNSAGRGGGVGRKEEDGAELVEEQQEKDEEKEIQEDGAAPLAADAAIDGIDQEKEVDSVPPPLSFSSEWDDEGPPSTSSSSSSTNSSPRKKSMTMTLDAKGSSQHQKPAKPHTAVLRLLPQSVTGALFSVSSIERTVIVPQPRLGEASPSRYTIFPSLGSTLQGAPPPMIARTASASLSSSFPPPARRPRFPKHVDLMSLSSASSSFTGGGKGHGLRAFPSHTFPTPFFSSSSSTALRALPRPPSRASITRTAINSGAVQLDALFSLRPPKMQADGRVAEGGTLAGALAARAAAVREPGRDRLDLSSPFTLVARPGLRRAGSGVLYGVRV